MCHCLRTNFAFQQITVHFFASFLAFIFSR
nr:MAG TPA: hypothetical protein [Caudoviricetes sp.]